MAEERYREYCEERDIGAHISTAQGGLKRELS